MKKRQAIFGLILSAGFLLCMGSFQNNASAKAGWAVVEMIDSETEAGQAAGQAAGATLGAGGAAWAGAKMGGKIGAFVGGPVGVAIGAGLGAL